RGRLARALSRAPSRVAALSCFLPDRSGLSAHRPSFPTRRSSDLPPDAKTPPDQSVRGCSVPYEVLCSAGCELVLALTGNHNHSQDRKSTRLNSSHVSISYAGFCLKKKTNKTG